MAIVHFAIAAIAAVALQANAEAVVALTPDTFDSSVGKDVPAFVEFYAPWCGHCKNLAPEWEKLGETFKRTDGVVIAKVDADAHRDLAGRFGVQGFPTIKWFPAGSQTPEDYEGGRTADDLVSFVNGKTGLKKRVKTVPSAVVALDSSNFDAVAADPTKHKLLEFYAPWCGHCKNLAPTYEKLGAVFEGESNVVIAKIDADKNRDLGDRFGVKGFPTLKYVPAGAPGKPEDAAEDYNGGRDLDAFVSFINKRAGTARSSDGGLLATAGRLEEFDDLAKAFVKATGADKAAKLKEAEEAASGLSGADAAKAKTYVAIMKKVIEKGADYVSKESARVEGMLKSSSIAPGKRTDMQLKQNVLAAFEQ